MRSLAVCLYITVVVPVFGCHAHTESATATSLGANTAHGDSDQQSQTVPKLRAVGTRGFYALDGPFAPFDPSHPSVEVWTPPGNAMAPIAVYAHGGAGYREDDRARVAMLRRNGFATISFDSYEMNGFDDWQFVTRRISNGGKQSMIWGVYKGAVEYAKAQGNWDNRNIFLYGGSNGGRVVLYAGTHSADPRIRGIISEAPAATGFALGDLTIPTIIPFGSMDNWAGKSETDFVWTRTYPNSPISIQAWVSALQEQERPVEFIFYQEAGHLLFAGPLKEVTVKRGKKVAFTAFEGAGAGVLEQYERDVMAFVQSQLAR